jgi:site-specific recombinase XerD
MARHSRRYHRGHPQQHFDGVARLLASFFRFASYELPKRSAQIQRVLAMPRKRYTRRLINFLTREEVVALFGAPDKRTWTGRRDHALIMLAVQTGLRLTEVTGLTRQSFTLRKAAYLQVIGKGRYEWTDESIDKGYRGLLTEEFRILKLARDGYISNEWDPPHRNGRSSPRICFE